MKRKPICASCSNNATYNETFDAYMCLFCNQWLENVCVDKECIYCRKRPDTPLNDIEEINQ
jgi:uncharacterized CHY-type Zn-finger protein